MTKKGNVISKIAHPNKLKVTEIRLALYNVFLTVAIVVSFHLKMIPIASPINPPKAKIYMLPKTSSPKLIQIRRLSS